MPIYEYICHTCKENFSLLQKVGATEKDTVCPECGSREIKKKISLFSCACPIDSGPATGGTPSGFSGDG
jgi:putative FmdB family regulatory protein